MAIAERTKFFDPDNRVGILDKPQCVVCGHAVRQPVKWWVRVVNGGMEALHRDDLAAYETKQAASEGGWTYDKGDCGAHPLGPDCRKTRGLQDYSFEG
jgi:hypothetical protein